MADPTGPVFSDAFVDAMKRVEAKRLMPEPVKKKLIRWSALHAPGLDQTSMSLWSFIGWLHTKATGFSVG
jgi:hypothetical protein